MTNSIKMPEWAVTFKLDKTGKELVMLVRIGLEDVEGAILVANQHMHDWLQDFGITLPPGCRDWRIHRVERLERA